MAIPASLVLLVLLISFGVWFRVFGFPSRLLRGPLASFRLVARAPVFRSFSAFLVVQCSFVVYTFLSVWGLRFLLLIMWKLCLFVCPCLAGCSGFFPDVPSLFPSLSAAVACFFVCGSLLGLLWCLFPFLLLEVGLPCDSGGFSPSCSGVRCLSSVFSLCVPSRLTCLSSSGGSVAARSGGCLSAVLRFLPSSPVLVGCPVFALMVCWPSVAVLVFSCLVAPMAAVPRGFTRLCQSCGFLLFSLRSASLLCSVSTLLSGLASVLVFFPFFWGKVVFFPLGCVFLVCGAFCASWPQVGSGLCSLLLLFSSLFRLPVFSSGSSGVVVLVVPGFISITGFGPVPPVSLALLAVSLFLSLVSPSLWLQCSFCALCFLGFFRFFRAGV